MARTPKPTAILKAAGTFRNDRHGKRLEVPAETPVSIRVLSPIGQRYWNAAIDQLSTAPVLGSSDAEALSRFCDLSAEYDEATSTDRKLKLSAALDRLGQQFGFTPASRSRITVNVKAPRKNEKGRFFGPRLAG